MFKNNIIEIIEKYYNEQETFKQDVKCILCKLNENSNRKVSIEDININELFGIFIEKEINIIKNNDTNAKRVKNIKEIILNLTLVIISMLVVSFDIHKYTNLSAKNNFIILIIVILSILVVAAVLMLVIYKIMLKDIVNDENKIINSNNLLKDYYLIKYINEKFYTKSMEEL